MSSRNLRGSGVGSSAEELKKIFNKFDKNGDGRICHDELREIFRELGSETTPEELNTIMAEFDKDGDGRIDLDEFGEILNGGSTKDLHDAFDLYDLDKNGRISAKELHEVLKRLGQKCSLKDCSKMITSVDADADADGHVNFEEFKNMMKK